MGFRAFPAPEICCRAILGSWFDLHTLAAGACRSYILFGRWSENHQFDVRTLLEYTLKTKQDGGAGYNISANIRTTFGTILGISCFKDAHVYVCLLLQIGSQILCDILWNWPGKVCAGFLSMQNFPLKLHQQNFGQKSWPTTSSV